MELFKSVISYQSQGLVRACLPRGNFAVTYRRERIDCPAYRLPQVRGGILRIYLSPTTLFCPTIPRRKSEIISTVCIGDLQSQGHFYSSCRITSINNVHYWLMRQISFSRKLNGDRRDHKLPPLDL